MKKSLIIPLLVAVAALSSCSRHHVGLTASTDVSQSVSNSAADSTNSVSARIKFVHVAVVEAETVERIRSLFTDASIKVIAEKIVVPEGGFHQFPPDTFFISVPEDAKAKAMALIREDAPKGKYWIQAGAVLDTPTNNAPEPTATAP